MNTKEEYEYETTGNYAAAAVIVGLIE